MSQYRAHKPRSNSTQRRLALATAVEVEENLAMVACTNCASSGDLCYYSSVRSVRCSACLRKNADCDGTFSLEEFRKIVDQKKKVQEASREKRKDIARRATLLAQAQAELASIQAEDVALQEELGRIEELSSQMIRREMEALGVSGSTGPAEQQTAPSMDDLFAWEIPSSLNVGDIVGQESG
jgi:cell division septum initiation protein DivIVA